MLNVFVNTNQDVLFTLLIVFGALITTYLLYLIFCFSFMFAFRKKVNISKRKINILLYQKAEALYSISKIIEEELDYNDKEINDFIENYPYIEYHEYESNEFREAYTKLDDLYKYILKKFDNKFIKNNEQIKKGFIVIEDCNNCYFSASQLFNSNATGFNYWRNLFLTKWIKNLFKIKEVILIN